MNRFLKPTASDSNKTQYKAIMSVVKWHDYYLSKMAPTPALWALFLCTWRPVASRMPSFTVMERWENDAISSSFQPDGQMKAAKDEEGSILGKVSVFAKWGIAKIQFSMILKNTIKFFRVRKTGKQVYQHAAGWPGHPETAHWSEGSVLPTPPKWIAVYQLPGRYLWLGRSAEERGEKTKKNNKKNRIMDKL